MRQWVLSVIASVGLRVAGQGVPWQSVVSRMGRPPRVGGGLGLRVGRGHRRPRSALMQGFRGRRPLPPRDLGSLWCDGTTCATTR